MTYKEIACKTACHKIQNDWLPYSWDLNVYRGCEHGCKYCYALYSHRYLGSERYYDEIYIKTNVAERLEIQLKSRTWDRTKILNLGGVTDNYQPLEAKYKLMPDILKLLKKYRTPCMISTKSDLILRDYDLFADLARTTYLGIAVTITCMDEDIRKLIEPNVISSRDRFKILKEFSKTDAVTGMHFMPVIPFITDSAENADALFCNAKDSGIDYVLPSRLNLIGKTRRTFLEFVKRAFPKFYAPICELYSDGNTGKEYRVRLYTMLNEIKRKYGLSADYSRKIKEKLSSAQYAQKSLFDG